MARAKKPRPGTGVLDTDQGREAPRQRRGRILLVDDDELLAQVGQEMLRCLGYEVAIETSSLEALATFRTTPQQFVLVIVDYDMPRMTGEVLARELRRICPHIPLILCTGHSISSVEQAHLLGFDVLLRKPFRLHDLALAIDLALMQRAATPS